MSINITRRDALCAAGAFVGVFIVGGSASVFASSDRYVRPPGGQDEARFRALCLKCDRCRSVCPRGVIVPASVDDSLLDARTPVMNFHFGYCDFCGLCQKACPSQALEVEFDVATEKLGIAQVNTQMCLAYANGCEKCKDSCPYDALVFDERKRPTVNDALCNGCGACVDACQVNVLGVYSGSERALEVRPLEKSHR